MHRVLLSTILVLGVFSTIGMRDSQAQTDDPVVHALSGYHFSATAAELEATAGGEDQLVSRLLELRTQERPPFVGIRAAKVLMSYTHREDVKSAMLADMDSPTTAGLARLMVTHIDAIKEPSLRRNLAEAAVKRADKEENFKNYVRQLTTSSDEEVQRIAREAN